jgi:hypothetical protein
MCLSSQATQEAKIRGIVVPGQSQSKKKKTFFMRSSSQWEKLGMVAHACHPSNGGKHKIGGSQSKVALANSKTLSPK